MKIFNISFQRNATLSFHHFMKNNRYRSIHASNNCNFNVSGTYLNDLKVNSFSRIDNMVNSYDCFSDNPWNILYKDLDKRYTDKKFILFVRDPYKWMNSLIRSMGGVNPSIWEPRVYGTDGDVLFNEIEHLRVYKEHIISVLEYFHSRDDFLFINLENETNESVTSKLEDFIGFVFASFSS